MQREDPHHCRCFSIEPKDIEYFRDQIEQLGFEDEIQENHGQVFGRVLRMQDDLQLHLKVMSDGNIEAEMEPPPAYPFAHLNQEHSYSAHLQLEQIIPEIHIAYSRKTYPPETCLNPKIKKPTKPTHAKTIAAVAVTGLAIGALVNYLSKDDDEESL